MAGRERETVGGGRERGESGGVRGERERESERSLSCCLVKVCWAHPKFGTMLASCSYDHTVVVWKEGRQGDWSIVFKGEDHSASVNAAVFSPWQYGLHLACASSDGTVSVYSHNSDNTWRRKVFSGHPQGVTCLAWGNAVPDPSVTVNPTMQQPGTQQLSPPQMVTGGCDNQVRIWTRDEVSQEWVETHLLSDDGHQDWIRDVSWRPCVGLSHDTIASCSEDHTVIIWTREGDGHSWTNAQTINLGAPVWKVSWSVTGTVLAVSSGDSTVTTLRESTDGKWEDVTHTLNS